MWATGKFIVPVLFMTVYKLSLNSLKNSFTQTIPKQNL